jgi:hypothetical protein
METNIPKNKRKWNGHGLTVEGSRKGMAKLRELHPEKVKQGAVAGGTKVGNTIHICAKCGRELKGNSAFGMHRKKCMRDSDK